MHEGKSIFSNRISSYRIMSYIINVPGKPASRVRTNEKDSPEIDRVRPEHVEARTLPSSV